MSFPRGEPIPAVYLQEEGISDEQIPPRGGYEERLKRWVRRL